MQALRQLCLEMGDFYSTDCAYKGMAKDQDGSLSLGKRESPDAPDQKEYFPNPRPRIFVKLCCMILPMYDSPVNDAIAILVW